MVDEEAAQLLAALKRAGCECFIDEEDGNLYVSPPLRRIRWPDDPEDAIEDFYDELRALVLAESHRPAQRFTIHERRGSCLKNALITPAPAPA
jgi:hypothetical protein